MLKWLMCLVLMSGQAFAERMELKDDSRSIFVDAKSGWELKRELFGMPFLYFSPQLNGQRSNISFTDTEAELELDPNALGSSQEKYQTGRKKWAETVGAKVISYLPYKTNKTDRGHNVHQIGVSYEHENLVYVERSFYVECRGRILFAKSLRLSKNVEHDKDFNDLINSLDCGGL